MIESALTAIADPFSASVAARTRFSRVAGRNVPTGMSTNAGATRFPDVALLGLRAHGDGNHHAERPAAGRLTARVQQIVQPPADRRRAPRR